MFLYFKNSFKWGVMSFQIFSFCSIFLTVTGVSTQTPYPTTSFITPLVSSKATSSATKEPSTKRIAPTRTSSTQGFLYTLAPTTEGSQLLCPHKKCQNGGSCKQMKCNCLKEFSGVYCEVYEGKLKTISFFTFNVSSVRISVPPRKFPKSVFLRLMHYLFRCTH